MIFPCVSFMVFYTWTWMVYTIEKKKDGFCVCTTIIYLMCTFNHVTHMLHDFYCNNNNIIHANIYYIQFYITF